jgi:putative Mg2+ transporter-C (MgtC) family protein
MVLGGIIGMEREIAEKPAGLRTHMLVAGAAALLVSLGDVAIQHVSIDVGSGLVRSDPIRIIEAVVTGVSFLGAGTIIRHHSEQHVEGLTTAASILFAAAVGMSVALAQWVLATGATVLALLTLRAMEAVRNQLRQRAGTTRRAGEGANEDLQDSAF